MFPSALTRGSRVAGYEILERLQSGGMATVYVARPLHAPHQRVALKVAHPHLTDDPEVVRMFRNEARLAAAIDHPNVVAVCDVGESDGRHYMVLEFVDGVTLAKLMQPRPGIRARFPTRVSVWLVGQVASALHVAHELRADNGRHLGVVHRDVSPHNILVSRRGEVKLIDFGIAKASDMHTRGVMKGKPAYIAPEHIRGLPVDRRADVYALGVVLWELLTGRRRFRRDSEVDTLRAVLNARSVPPSRLVATIPKAIDEVVLRAMARQPRQRFEDVNAFTTALCAALGGAPENKRRALAAMVQRNQSPTATMESHRPPARPISGVMPMTTAARPAPKLPRMPRRAAPPVRPAIESEPPTEVRHADSEPPTEVRVGDSEPPTEVFRASQRDSEPPTEVRRATSEPPTRVAPGMGKGRRSAIRRRVTPTAPPAKRTRAGLIPIVLSDVALVDVDPDRAELLEKRLWGYAATGPFSTPAQFQDLDSALAFYLDAFITAALLTHASAHASHSLRETHIIDSRTITLADLDAELSAFEDGRLYAAVREAIRHPGVPPPFTPESLDERLNAATRALIADPACVEVSHATQRVRVPSRMWLHSTTFEKHAQRIGAGSTLLDFLIAHAGEAERCDLCDARTLDYEISYGRRL